MRKAYEGAWVMVSLAVFFIAVVLNVVLLLPMNLAIRGNAKVRGWPLHLFYYLVQGIWVAIALLQLAFTLGNLFHGEGREDWSFAQRLHHSVDLRFCLYAVLFPMAGLVANFWYRRRHSRLFQ